MSKHELVCLDTSVIRDIIDGVISLSSDFELIKKDFKIKFRIAETSYAEILSDLFDSSITFSEWRTKKVLINNFLDSECPIQEQGYNLSVDMETFKEKKERNTYYKKAYWVKIWEHIYDAKNENDLKKPLIYFHEHKRYIIRIKEDLIDPAFQAIRDNWYDYFDKVRNSVNDKTSISDILNVFIYEFSKIYEISKMMDFISVLARYTHLYIKDKKFNPYSTKRRNDSIDFSFLQLLAKPAIFCTADDKFYRFVQASDSPNKSNIMKLEDVIKYFLV